MILSNSILEDIRERVGLTRESIEFDSELVTLINGAIMTLRQNGVGSPIVVEDETKTWQDFKDDSQVNGNEFFSMVQSYLMLSVKVLFDPPPPSMVEHYSQKLNEILWRLRLAYEMDNL